MGAERRRAARCSAATPTSSPWSARRGLPLAHARNAGARHALRDGAELLVFLDVDCIPGPDLSRATRRPPPRGPPCSAARSATSPRAARRATPRPASRHWPARTPRARSRPRTRSTPAATTACSGRSRSRSRRDVAAHRRVLRGLRRLRRRGHRLRTTRAPGRRRPRLGRRRVGVPPASPDAVATRPASPRHPAQRRDLQSPMGLVADGGMAHGVRRARPRPPRPGGWEAAR